MIGKEKIKFVRSLHQKKFRQKYNKFINKPQTPAASVDGDAFFLDGIQIPNNVGAILRIADWFHINHIILAPTTADIFSPKVIQASMGSFLRLKFTVVDASSLKSSYESHQIIVADGSGISVNDFTFPKPTILVMGSEGRGPSTESLSQADHVVKIDRVGGDFPESLNVSVAAGILCHAWKG